MDQAEHILHTLPCGCLIFDDQGRMTFVNDSLCRTLGYSSEDILNKSTEVILTISSRIFYQTHFFPLLKLQGEVAEIFLTLRARDGSHIPVMIHAKADSLGKPSSYICVLSTVFERQKYEEQLLVARKSQQKALEENEHLNQLKGELEANQYELDRKLLTVKELNKEYIQMGKVLMHDMQEPIRKIGFFFDALLAGSEQDAGSGNAKKLEIIQRSINRLRQLTASLQDFVYINSVKEAITWLSPMELILQARDLVMKDLDCDDFDLHIAPFEGFEGRASLIRRVFFELIKNAVQNKHPGSKLVISISGVLTQENIYQINADKYRYTDHISIEICDNGIGFDSEYATYIFGLLNKLNKNSSGVGLGLAISNQIISHHYGTIKARPLPGRGTSIVIVLPIKQSS